MSPLNCHFIALSAEGNALIGVCALCAWKLKVAERKSRRENCDIIWKLYLTIHMTPQGLIGQRVTLSKYDGRINIRKASIGKHIKSKEEKKENCLVNKQIIHWTNMIRKILGEKLVDIKVITYKHTNINTTYSIDFPLSFLLPINIVWMTTLNNLNAV